LHIYTCVEEPPQILFPIIRFDNVGSLFAAVDAFFEERAKHPLLLVEVVEDSANVPVLAESTSGTLNWIATNHVPSTVKTPMFRADRTSLRGRSILRCLPIVGDTAGAAILAALDMAAERSRAAVLDGRDQQGSPPTPGGAFFKVREIVNDNTGPKSLAVLTDPPTSPGGRSVPGM